MTNEEARNVLRTTAWLGYGGQDKVEEAVKMACEALEQPRWIPVSERLPEPNEKDVRGFTKAYLVQDARWMDVARWDGDNWIAWGYGTRLENVIAWMLLPEPYSGGREDGKVT